jgi:hypothetical protein
MLEGVLCFEYFYGAKKWLLGAVANEVNRDLHVILMEK